MTERYLQMLEQSLDQKKLILDQLMDLTRAQNASLEQDPILWEEFDELVDKKARLIERLDKMDDGFESVYGRIREEMDQNHEQHKERILSMQKKIQAVTDASASLMAAEQKNKVLVETKLSEEKKRLQQNKASSKAATNYYRSMNKVNYIDPQLMDKKK